MMTLVSLLNISTETKSIIYDFQNNLNVAPFEELPDLYFFVLGWLRCVRFLLPLYLRRIKLRSLNEKNFLMKKLIFTK